MGDHAAAANVAAQMAKLAINPALDHYNSACVLARAAAVARKDVKLPAPRRAEMAGNYEARAVGELSQAVAAEFNDAPHMKEDPDLVSLRPRDDFRKLLADLEAKLRKKG